MSIVLQIVFSLSKVKVTDQGQMENSFLEHNFHILCLIFISCETSFHHSVLLIWARVNVTGTTSSSNDVY